MLRTGQIPGIFVMDHHEPYIITPAAKPNAAASAVGFLAQEKKNRNRASYARCARKKNETKCKANIALSHHFVWLLRKSLTKYYTKDIFVQTFYKDSYDPLSRHHHRSVCRSCAAPRHSVLSACCA
jgi:hypothetical protein